MFLGLGFVERQLCRVAQVVEAPPAEWKSGNAGLISLQPRSTIYAEEGRPKLAALRP